MKISSVFSHYNFNVYNLEKSLEFYDKALGLKEKRRRTSKDGSFILAFLEDGKTGFQLELTWLKDRDTQYDLGDNEVHLCVHVDGDYDEIKKYHADNGWICYENTDMNLYFIEDPDGYWIEILPLD